ncbi:MAG: hypothetical protein U1E26_07830 [Coriobacteriia bacterium]|nr:hypothetical protein [Coriobacteriia bacterium]
MRGTRLWQAAGSPLIQGRSRAFVPYWRHFVFALAACGVIVAVYDVATSAGPQMSLEGFLSVGASLVAGLAYGFVPAAVSVGIFRRLNTRHVWFAAGLFSAVLVGAARLVWPL